MSLLNKLKDLSDKIKEDNKDLSGVDIHQNFTKALRLEPKRRIETKTDKGITVLLRPDEVVRLAVGCPSLRIKNKGTVDKYKAVEALLRWDIK